jgi:hypothetical protein
MVRNKNHSKPQYIERTQKKKKKKNTCFSIAIGLFSGTPGLDSYWQNDWHYRERTAISKDVPYTFYNVFSRIISSELQQSYPSRGCYFKPLRPLEATLYSKSNNLVGLLVLFEARHSVDGRKYRLEGLMQPQKVYNILRPLGPTTRLIHIEVNN